MTPLPSLVVRMRSAVSSSGSPKNASAPCWSSSTILRSSTPAVADESPPMPLSSALPSVAGEVLQHRAQVVEVDQRESGLVGVVEHEGERRRLRLVGAEHLGQELRAERRHRGAHRHAGRRGRRARGTTPDGRSASTRPRARRRARSPCRWAHPASSRPERSPLMSAANTGDAHRRELLGHELERLRLAGAGRARDQAVPVAHAGRDLHHGLGDHGALEHPAPERPRRGRRWRTPAATRVPNSAGSALATTEG